MPADCLSVAISERRSDSGGRVLAAYFPKFDRPSSGAAHPLELAAPAPFAWCRQDQFAARSASRSETDRVAHFGVIYRSWNVPRGSWLTSNGEGSGTFPVAFYRRPRNPSRRTPLKGWLSLLWHSDCTHQGGEKFSPNQGAAMTLLDFLILLLVAGICGAVGQAIVGYSRGGCLASIALGFIG